MKRTKPLKIDEKASRIEALLQQKKSFFNLKEVEKMGQKEKGVVPQSTKEVLDLLASEGRIKEAKIGTTRYYWSFLSDAKIERENKINTLQKELDILTKKEQFLEEKIFALNANRKITKEREQNLSLYYEQKKIISKLDEQLEMYKENNPEHISALEEECSSLVQEINTHVENIFSIRSYVISKFNIDPSEFDKIFNIPQDLDTIE